MTKLLAAHSRQDILAVLKWCERHPDLAARLIARLDGRPCLLN